ncbi:unnamed protein product [Arabidopsis thaliana]|uniref:F-box domain-containing protein n=1 Tax=Arabidopsis thaliana TaxID=3702 RepID=A0A654F9Q0_ARATH|nr:unnamed protein product [Arabidopsis thaliana]
MTIPELPKDLIEEILCYVPATYLKRLRSTCKGWNRLFKDDRRFAKKHYDKAAKQFLPLMSTNEELCAMSVNLHGTIPSLEDATLFLDTIKEDKKTYYKILSFYLDSKDFEIFEFNSDSWRFIDDICPGLSLLYSDQCVSLKGNTYMFAIDDLSVSLLKYDFSTETSVPVPLPYKSRSFEAISLSVVREEKLSVLLQRDKSSKTEIWVTNVIDETTTKVMVVSWSKVLSLDLSPDLKIRYGESFLLDEEKKVIMIFNNRMEEENKSEDKLYIIGDDDNKATQVYTIHGYGPAVFNYFPSLVQIEQSSRQEEKS